MKEYRLRMFAESHPDIAVGKPFEFGAGSLTVAIDTARGHVRQVVGPDNLLGDLLEKNNRGDWSPVAMVSATHAEVTL